MALGVKRRACAGLTELDDHLRVPRLLLRLEPLLDLDVDGRVGVADPWEVLLDKVSVLKRKHIRERTFRCFRYVTVSKWAHRAPKWSLR